MAQKGFYVNMKRCLGCATCQVTCKDKFDLDAGEFGRRVTRYEGGSYPKPYVYSVSLACGHCDRPWCRAACPAGAIAKDKETGLVLIDEKRCLTDCHKCEQACPYTAISFVKATRKVVKCNGCKERLDVGKEPLCVVSCRTRALEFGDIATLRAKHTGWVNQIKGYADPANTGPNVIFNPRREAI